MRKMSMWPALDKDVETMGERIPPRIGIKNGVTVGKVKRQTHKALGIAICAAIAWGVFLFVYWLVGMVIGR